MGWFNFILSPFRRREKVDLLNSHPDILHIVPPTLKDQVVVPGMPRVPDANLRVGTRGLTYFNTKGGGREWIPPQYNHVEIEHIFDIESLFARATRAKLFLFLKEGYEFVGPNDERVKYIRARFRQISRASGIPLELLLHDTCRDLIVHSNAYWLKIRKLEASGGKIRQIGNSSIKPIAGLFRLAPETMIPEIDTSGNIIRWKQSIGGEEVIFNKNDIVHFSTNKKGGYPLGVPSIVPAIDDIRALRSLEHNIDILVHKHLFPIILWRVGTDNRPAQTFSDGLTEVEVVQDVVANMPTEGSLVVSERYDVKAIGAENKALRVETYLQHFKERLLAGLDVSAIDVGGGTASSRSTAQTLSRNLMDAVKLHQIIMEKFIQPVIDELLLESTFSPESVLLEENIVRLRFHEIDKEAKQSEANHLTDLFSKNVITFPELRTGIGREGLTPEEEKELYWNKFGREEALIGSVDELSGKGADPPAGSGTVSNKNQPANQNGSRSSAKINKDSYSVSKKVTVNPILAWHQAIGAELQARYAQGELKFPLAESDIRTAYNVALDEFKSTLRSIVRHNYPDPEKVYGISKYMDNRAEKYINRLRDEVIKRLKTTDNTPNVIFSALSYRAVLIFDTELAYADNVSKYRWFSNNKTDVKIVSSDEPCNLCKPKLTIIKWDDKLGEANIPPFHPLCKCKIIAVEG